MLAGTDKNMVGRPPPSDDLPRASALGRHRTGLYRARQPAQTGAVSRINFSPLIRYLTNHASSRVKLLFEDLEQMLGQQLPHAASLYREWWANDGRQSQSLAWVESGWDVEAVYLQAGVVTFVARR